jgi:hypothetical protein
MLPKKTWALGEEKVASGHKENKIRFTFLPCANQSGDHKLPLMVIGTAKQPRCFPKDISSMPIHYRANKSAWMTRDLFKEWFHDVFVVKVREYSATQGIPAEAILLLDNCSAHHFDMDLRSDDGLIKTAYLPPNVTSIGKKTHDFGNNKIFFLFLFVGQPMDQTVIANIKVIYKKKLLRSLLLDSENQNFNHRMKAVNIFDAVKWLVESWNEISPINIIKSWSKISHVSEFTHYEALEEVDDELETENLYESIKNISDFSQDDLMDWFEDKREDGDESLTEVLSLEDLVKSFVTQGLKHIFFKRIIF